MSRRKTFINTLLFRKQQSPSLRVFQSILNINFSRISSHHRCFRIPLFLDIFQLLGQIFSYICFCFVFLCDNWSKYFDWLKKQSLHDIRIYINVIGIFLLWLTGYNKNVSPFQDGGSYHIELQSKSMTGFYMITASVMKGLTSWMFKLHATYK